MHIWHDACTGKHLRYGVAVAKRLRNLGHKVTITTRRHPDTIGVARILGEKIVVVGKYDPTSLYSRLLEGTRRQLHFCKMFKDRSPDVAISNQSPELCRVAFGLGIPTITTSDSPHAVAANKLTLPFTGTLIISKALPRKFYERFGVEKIVSFDGVDEAAWIKGFRPVKADFEHPLIIVRQMETAASYAERRRDISEELAYKLTSLGNVMFISRYERRHRQGLTIPRGFVDTASLAAHADLVVSVGGTIAREAALQGTPSLIIPLFGRFHTNEYLARKDFPLYTRSAKKALAYAKKYLGAKKDVKESLEELESPVDTIEKLILGDDECN